MGYLKSLGTSIIYIGAFFAILTFIPGFPPDANFSEYSITLPKELSAELAFNEKLNNPEILFKGQIEGPESFASYNGELYTGTLDGYVVKVLDNKLVPIVKFGEDCDGPWQEAKCGRPLGMKFDKNGFLYVCDAYYGIFKVDVKTAKYEKIVDAKKPIEGKYPKIVNSLDIASNGDIYWSHSSTEFDLNDGAYTMMANPSGRLIRYDAKSKKNQVLLHNLAFPNGVLLSDDESFVIVLESLASRILKFNIKGSNAGKYETFVEGLPGIPDNVHSDNNKGFLVSLVLYADSKTPQLSQSLIPHPYIRRFIARFIMLLELPFKYMHMYYPNEIFEKINHYLGSFQSTLSIFPSKIVTVLRINDKGKVVDALYATDEKISGISSAYIHDKHLWLGSPWAHYIARVPLNKLFKNVQSEKKSDAADKQKVKKEKKPSPSNKI